MKKLNPFVVFVIVTLIATPIVAYYLTTPSDKGLEIVVEQTSNERFTVYKDCEYIVETDVWIYDWKGFPHSLPFSTIGCATKDNLDSLKVAQINEAKEARDELLKKYPKLAQ